MFNKFFRLSIYTSAAKIQPDKFVRWCQNGDFYVRPVFAASHVQQVSDLHSKFALRPHHVCKYGNIQPATAEIKRGKKKDRRKKIEITG